MADPSTCLHNVVAVNEVRRGLDCGSCGEDMSSTESRRGKNYKFDSKHKVWVHVPTS